MDDEVDSMMANGKVSTDHYNFAFNPYAISTDDLTTDNDMKGDKSTENKGYLKESFSELSNPHYEDTLEVAKRAGLTGTGPRRKENIVYEETVFHKKNKDQTSKLRASNLPPRPIEEWTGESKKTNNQWRLPFGILCLLVLLGLIGGSLGVLAYFDKKKCSCNSPTSQALGTTQGEMNRMLERMNVLEMELTRTKNEQQAQLTNLTEMFNELKGVKLNVLSLTKEIDELRGLKSNVSDLKQDIDKLNDKLRSLDNLNQQLTSDVDNINSTLTIKLRNISKEIGPRGYNGSQGLQGPPGPGNLSSCVVGKEVVPQRIATPDAKLTKSQAVHEERQGWKVMAATCSTTEANGPEQMALSVTNNKRYICTCGGVASNQVFKPTGQDIECILIYWECPLFT